MEDKQLNSAESIALIQRMITHTREKYERGGGNSFLIFGYTSLFVGALTTLAIKLTSNMYFSFLWWLIPLIGFTLSYLVNRNKPKTVNTFIDKIIGHIWQILAIFLLLFPLAGMFSPLLNYMIIPFESLMLSIGILLTGAVIRDWTVIMSGVIAALLSFFMLFITTGYEYVFMAMFVLGMIIPGHILNYRARCSKN